MRRVTTSGVGAARRRPRPDRLWRQQRRGSDRHDAGGVGSSSGPDERPQGRSRLRHRRPRRPVVQRRRRRGPGQGQDRARHRGQGARGQQRRDRRPPRRSACACSPTRATTRSSRSASPTRRPSAKVAEEFPDTKFAIIDDAAAVGDNIANLVFAEEQGSFLVGAAAALKTKTGNVGFVGGVDVPLIQKFEAGYTAGAKAVEPGHQGRGQVPHPAAGLLRLQRPGQGQDGRRRACTTTAPTSSTRPPAAPVAACSRPPRPRARMAIGVDSDQYKTADPTVQRRHPHLDAQAGRRRGVTTSSSRSPTDSFTAGTDDATTSKKDGVGYSTSGGQIDDIKAKLDDYKAEDHRRRDHGPDQVVRPEPDLESGAGPTTGSEAAR